MDYFPNIKLKDKNIYQKLFSQKNLNDTSELLTSYINKDPHCNFVKENIIKAFNEIENYSFSELSKSIILNTLKQLKIETKILNCYDIIDINYVKKKNLSGGELVKLIVTELKPKRLYNFYNGVVNKIYPFGDFEFFKKQNCELYKQDIDKFLNNKNKDIILYESAIRVIARKGINFLSENLDLTYSKARS